ncbi:MAG: Flp pilus assembly protein CpaB [Acidocella sp. 20-63-7]|nr:MAG: Flp pilus assembly protein CpaB [Acidocella sp. 20-63-7]HQT46275.1 Flp pilus assembly protein CpaB [Acidocella sp.]
MVFRLGIFLFLIVALIAVSIFGYSLLNQSKQQQVVAPPPTTLVLVAATQLQAGSLIQPAGIASTPVLANAVPAGSLVDTPEDRSLLIGSMVRTSISQGAPILDGEVIHPGDHGFLSAVLSPGMRAVTIGVDNITGADGLIWPGDNVDVLLTESIPGAPADKSIASEVVLSNIRVIATGQELIKAAAPPPANGSAPPPAPTVTLEVTPDQAARCLVATNLGKLSLIVHSAEAQSAAAAKASPVNMQPVWAGDVSHALTNSEPTTPTVSTVHVYQGGSVAEGYNF